MRSAIGIRGILPGAVSYIIQGLLTRVRVHNCAISCGSFASSSSDTLADSSPSLYPWQSIYPIGDCPLNTLWPANTSQLVYDLHEPQDLRFSCMNLASSSSLALQHFKSTGQVRAVIGMRSNTAFQSTPRTISTFWSLQLSPNASSCIREI